jgi:hypothetical protein
VKFTGSQRLNAQGVDVSLQQVTQGCIDHTMALQQGLGCKRGRDDAHRIMAAALVGMACVLRTVILNIQFQGMKSGCQLLAQTFLAIIGFMNVPSMIYDSTFHELRCD